MLVEIHRVDQRELNALGVQGVAVFGSMARGEDGEGAHLDLVVAFTKPPRHTLLDVVRMQRTFKILPKQIRPTTE